jgi:hypothetical protein
LAGGNRLGCEAIELSEARLGALLLRAATTAACFVERVPVNLGNGSLDGGSCGSLAQECCSARTRNSGLACVSGACAQARMGTPARCAPTIPTAGRRLFSASVLGRGRRLHNGVQFDGNNLCARLELRGIPRHVRRYRPVHANPRAL